VFKQFILLLWFFYYYCYFHFILNLNRLIQRLMYEAEIHSKLRHPNIVSMLGVVFEQNNYGIILEYVTYGSWTSFLSHVANASGKFLQHHHHKHLSGRRSCACNSSWLPLKKASFYSFMANSKCNRFTSNSHFGDDPIQCHSNTGLSFYILFNT